MEKDKGGNSMKKKIVAFIHNPDTTVVLPATNLASILIHQLAKRLVHDYDVIVFSRRYRLQRKKALFDNVDYRRIGMVVDTVTNSRWKRKHKGLLPFFATERYYQHYMKRIVKEIQKRDISLVHIHNCVQIASFIKKHCPNVKIVLHMTNQWLTQLHAETIKERLLMIDIILCSSNFLLDKIRQEFSVISHRCHMLSYGVDKKCFHKGYIAKTGKQLLYVGRISPERGVHILLAAFKKIKRFYPQLRLALVGSHAVSDADQIVSISTDPHVKALEKYFNSQYIKKLKKKYETNDVQFLGAMPQSKIVKYHQNADVFVSPSIAAECAGIATIEALGCGLPVVASRHGCMRQFIDHEKNGLLVQRNNVDVLADALMNILHDKDSRQQMSEHALDSSRQYCWKDTTRVLKSLYQGLI